MFILFKFLFIMYCYYSIVPVCLPTSQKRAQNLIINDYEPPYVCCELNSEPLE